MRRVDDTGLRIEYFIDAHRRRLRARQYAEHHRHQHKGKQDLHRILGKSDQAAQL